MLADRQTPLKDAFPASKDSGFLGLLTMRLKAPFVLRTLALNQSVTTIELRSLGAPALFLISLILYLLSLSEVAALILGVFAAIHQLAYLWVVNATHNTHAQRQLLSAAVHIVSFQTQKRALLKNNK